MGQIEFENHLADKKHLPKGAIIAKCYDCMGFYADGTMDCECPLCPLYPWMPYRIKTDSRDTPAISH
jgi:hypothetical protein